MHPNSRDQLLLDIEERLAVSFPPFDSTATCTISTHARIFPDLEVFVRDRYPLASVIPQHKKLMFESVSETGRFTTTFDLGVSGGAEILTGKHAIDAMSASAESMFNHCARSHLQEIRDSLVDDTRYALIEFAIRHPALDYQRDQQRYALFGHPRRFPYPIKVVMSQVLVSNSSALWFARPNKGNVATRFTRSRGPRGS